jgi:hypothetical protein
MVNWPWAVAARTTWEAVMKTPGATANAVPKKSGRASSAELSVVVATTGNTVRIMSMYVHAELG